MKWQVTIIFSIGYAPDKNGVFRMNFGPLGQSGGEKRLNVAITRAKFNTKLVGSIRPEDIIVESISTEGPKLLRAYIDYAMHGTTVLENAIDESDKGDLPTVVYPTDAIRDEYMVAAEPKAEFKQNAGK